MDDRNKLLYIIGETKGIPPENIDLSQEISDLDINSLDVVEMLMGIEEQFEVYLPVNNDLSKAKTLGELVDILEQLIADARAGSKDG